MTAEGSSAEAEGLGIAALEDIGAAELKPVELEERYPIPVAEAERGKHLLEVAPPVAR